MGFLLGFFFICGVSVRIFEVIVFAGSHNGFGIENKGIHGDDTLLDEGFVNFMMNFLYYRIIDVLQEAIKLAFIRQFFHHVEAAHFSDDRMIFKVFNQARNRDNAFKSLYDEGSEHSSARIAGAADTPISVWQVR